MNDLADDRISSDQKSAWIELETTLTNIEKNAFERVTERQLIALPSLYRDAMSSLARARRTLVDDALSDHLEALCRRAYFLIYGIDETLGGRAAQFLRHDWHRTVRDLMPEFLISLSLIILGLIAGWAQVTRDPDSFYALVPSSLAQGRNPSASITLLRNALSTTDDFSSLAAFATQLFTHNIEVACLAVALGFFLCVPSALLMLYNGAVLGAMMSIYATNGLAVEFAGWAAIHGVTETIAIALAGACGLRIGRAFILPGQDQRRVSLKTHGQRVAPVIVVTVFMLLCAGFLEGVGRQLIISTPARFAAGACTLLFLGLVPFRAMEKWCRGSRERTVKTTSEHGRELSTPEGLSLRLRVAYTSERLVALLIDVAIVLGATQALSMFCQLLAAGHAGKELITVIWTLGFFVLRNLYFAFFEIRPIAASLGKRLLRLRVVSRDGGKLTVDAVFLRGLTREFELWIPYLVFRYSSWDVVSRLSDLFWVVVFLCVPLLSPDRTRVGDLIAGTCVVAVPRSGLRDQTRFATRAA